MAKKDVNRLKIMLAVTNTCQPDLETLIRISDLLKVDVNGLLNKECIKECRTIY